MQPELVTMFFRRRTVDAVRDLLAVEGLLDDGTDGWLRRIEDLEDRSAIELASTVRSWPVEWTRIGVLRYLINGRGGRTCTIAPWNALRDVARHTDDLVILRFAEFTQARYLVNSGRDTEGEALLMALADEGFEANPFDALLQCYVLQWESWMAVRSGDCNRAEEKLGEALRIAERRDFCLRWGFRSMRGSLFCLTGRFRESIRELTDEEFHHATAAQGDIGTLIHSHLTTADAALHLGATAKANLELAEAKELLDGHADRFPIYNATLIHFSAKLDRAWGNRAESLHLLDYAMELYSNLDPPYRAGVLHVKLEKVRLDLDDGDHGAAYERCKQLILEAEDAGELEARTHLLAFLAELLEGDAPSDIRRRAYRALERRVATMGIPYQKFITYSRLYAFARDQLSLGEQQRWLRGLKEMGPSFGDNYDDLYRTHVLERYRREIEGRLRRLDDDLDHLQGSDAG